MHLSQTWKWLLAGYIVGSLFGFTQIMGLFSGVYGVADRNI